MKPKAINGSGLYCGVGVNTYDEKSLHSQLINIQIKPPRLKQNAK